MTETNPEDFKVHVHPPLFLLSGKANCWKCQQSQPVIALSTLSLLVEGESFGSETEDEPQLLVLSYIEKMPSNMEAYIDKVHPRYKKHFSHTAKFSYFANFCECGANFGDHYLREVDAIFFPTTEEDAAKVTISKLPFDSVLEFCASWSEGAGDLIWKHGRRA